MAWACLAGPKVEPIHRSSVATGDPGEAALAALRTLLRPAGPSAMDADDAPAPAPADAAPQLALGTDVGIIFVTFASNLGDKMSATYRDICLSF